MDPGRQARAPLDAILKSWEGLGYYSRARNLHKAARIVVALHGGRLPSSVEELTKLPGIGRSTAGAIAAIAFRRDEPILDANVTTLIAAAVLYQFGTGPVRGFAVTLSLGVVASIFTAVVVSRVVFDYVLNTQKVKSISI